MDRPKALYQGYDTFADAGRGTAVSGPAGRQFRGLPVQVSGIFIGQDAVMSAMGLERSPSSLFAFGAKDPRVTFVDGFQMNALSVAVLVHARTQVTLSAAAATLLATPNNVKAFFTANGDSYVYELVQGSWYCALWVIHPSSQAEQDAAVGRLHGMGITAQSFAQAGLDSIATAFQIPHAFDHQALGFTRDVRPDAKTVVSFANGFAQLVPDDPFPFEYQTAGYEGASGMTAFSSVVSSRNLSAAHAAEYASLDQAARAASALNTIYAAYGYTGDTQLQTRSAQITTDKSALGVVLQNLESDPTQTYTVPALPSLAYGVPQLNAPVNPVQYFGGTDGGNAFQDVDAGSLLTTLNVRTITVWGEYHAHQISTSYVVRDPVSKLVTRTYKNTAGGGNGNPGTPSPVVLTFAAADRVKQIDVLWSWDDSQHTTAVQQLTITSTNGQKLDWPTKMPTSAASSGTWKPLEDTEVFIGFAGKAGYVLNTIGVVSAVFGPATWNKKPD